MSIQKELELFDEEFKGWILQDNEECYRGFDRVKQFLISSHIRLMEEMVRECEMRKIESNWDKKSERSGLQYQIEGENDGYDSIISHLQDIITNLKKELR
tara:strand:+ start:319 stop:618 length:300 start_codon:yes stop_codon:yes gene_type:complete